MLHEKHRERLRKKFTCCPDSMAKHELLELLLTFCIPRKNTNTIAHELLNKFNTVSSVIDASSSSLRSVNGIGEVSSMFFDLIKTVFRICLEEKSTSSSKDKNKKLTLNDVLNMMFVKFFGRDEEYVAATLFNSKKEIVFCDFIEKGSQSFVEVNVKNLISLVLEHDTKYIVLAHNHPSTIALPSKEDIKVTEQIDSLLDVLGVTLLDHFILCEDNYVSLFESGILGKDTSGTKSNFEVSKRILKKTG